MELRGPGGRVGRAAAVRAAPAVRAAGTVAAAATLAALLLLPAAAHAQLTQRGVHVPEGSFELASAGGSGPRDARDLAADPEGRVHVVDRDGAVFVYARSGAHERTYGAGVLDDPVALAMGPGGDVFVLDEGEKRVFVFGPTGELRTSFGDRGRRAGQLDDPKDVALGPNGFVYVLEKRQRSVHVYSADGVFVRSVLFGDVVRDPAALAVARDGTIFITDKDAEGWIHTLPPFAEVTWGAGPTGVPPQRLTFRGTELAEPLGVTVNRFGTVLVVDEDTGELWMRNVGESQPAGPNDYLYGGSGRGPGGFREATAVTFDGDVEALVLDRDLGKVERVRLTTEDGRAELDPFDYPIRVTRGPAPLAGLIHAVGYDEAGPVFLSATGEGSIAMVRAETEEAETVYGDRALFHRPGPEAVPLMPPDGFDRVSGAALSDSLVVVTDRGRDRFSAFARDDGRWLGDFGRNYEDDRRLDDPVGVAVRPDGSVVTADRRNDRVVVISPDRTQKLADFPFREAWGLARSPGDRVVVWSENGQQSYLIDLTRGIGETFSGPLVPARIAGAAFDDAGNLFLLDGETGRVTVLDADLDRILFQAGAHEEVRRPRGLVVDRDGNIYVGDEDGPHTVLYRWDVRADPPETVAVARGDASATLAWAPGPRAFIRHYRVEGAPEAGAAYRTLATPEDTVFRLDVADVDDAFPRLLRVVPVFITGSAGEATGPVSIVGLTARVAYRHEDWETASRDAARALAGLDEGDPAADELRWIRFRSAWELEDHAEVVRLAETVVEQVPEEALGDFHLTLMRSHMAVGNTAEAAGSFGSAAGALDPERLRGADLAAVPLRIFHALDSAGAREEGLAFLREISRALPDELAELRTVYQDSVAVMEVRESLGEGLEALETGAIPSAQEFFEERLSSGAIRSEREMVVAMFGAAIAAHALRRLQVADEWVRQIYEDDPDFSFEESFDQMVRLYGLGFYDSPELREFFLEIERESREGTGGGPGGDGGDGGDGWDGGDGGDGGDEDGGGS